MPLNADPDPDGNIRLEEHDDGRVECVVMNEMEMADYNGMRFKSHYATCPKAAKFRKPK